MHILDCKGVAASVYGNLLATLIKEPRLGRSQQARLDAIQHDIDTWYAAHPGVLRLPRLTPASLINAGCADLHGPAIKSAMCRHAAPMFVALARAHVVSPTAHDEAIRKVTSALEEFYIILGRSPMFLANAQVQRLTVVCMDVGINYQRFRGICVDQCRLFLESQT